MVWKAAAQTRLRMFKHGNGIAVGVIACFQPLQNCQVMRKKDCLFVKELCSSLCNSDICFGIFAVG
jgi:hypothetical protein